MQGSSLNGERLKEVNAAYACLGSGTRHLEVARAGKDDAALHDVIGYDVEERPIGRRAEDESAIRVWEAALHKGM